MKATLHAIACIAFVFFTSASDAQVLWQGARYGMTLDEVAAAFPAGERVTPSEQAKSYPEVELFTVRGIELAKTVFDASFMFKQGKLVRVNVETQDDLPSLDLARVKFESLRNALEMKYGKELRAENKGGMFPLVMSVWLSGQTTIRLLAYTVGGPTAKILVGYAVDAANDAAKL